MAHVAPPMAQPTQQQPVTPQQQQFPIQIQNSTETVIMEVMPGNASLFLLTLVRVFRKYVTGVGIMLLILCWQEQQHSS